MIYDLIHYICQVTGMRWRIGGTLQIPSEGSVKGALDEAARLLYDERVGNTLTVDNLGLHVVKTTKGFDVYAKVGEYK